MVELQESAGNEFCKVKQGKGERASGLPLFCFETEYLAMLPQLALNS
jgi:hypothetical protein